MAKASRTAVLVAQARAITDPASDLLLTGAERETVRRVRAHEPPRGLGGRFEYETVKAAIEVMGPRTAAIDDALRDGPHEQVVLLGAGLDTRRWRLPALASSAFFEVDQPASQAEKRRRAAVLGEPRPAYVPVDFTRDRLGPALAAAGYRAGAPTTWVWEGVVPYLTPPQVANTVAAVAKVSAPGSRLIVNYQEPGEGLYRLSLLIFTKAGQVIAPWRGEAWRSAWTAESMGRLLRSCGYDVRKDVDLYEVAEESGLSTRHSGNLHNSRVATAIRSSA